ncbi:MAG: TauD/TfdA dioxygenase family protein [Acetobacteraceae bacterium]
MSQTAIEVRPLTPTIGAEIFGVDLGGEISNQQYDAIHEALLRHVVIFFRDQKMTPEQHKAFGRRFGKLHLHPASPNLLEGHPEILLIQANEKSKRVAGEVWHSDVSCDPEPPMGSILYMHETPANGGGDTMFANMYTAFETLSAPMQRFLEGLSAVHDGEHVYRGRYGWNDSGKTYPRSVHPVVRTHPETGRKALFVNRGFTTAIEGLNRDESDALLEMLYDHAETPEYQCRFKWQPGSVAFWDNRAAMHHAMWDYFPHSRRAHRVTICGDRPFYRA